METLSMGKEYPSLDIISRGVGTCVREGGKTKSGGAKDMNFKEKPIFFSNFG